MALDQRPEIKGPPRSDVMFAKRRVGSRYSSLDYSRLPSAFFKDSIATQQTLSGFVAETLMVSTQACFSCCHCW